MIFFIVRMYSFLYGYVKDHFKRNLPGLGYALRKIKRNHVLDIQGRKMFFSHKVAVCYGRPISGAWNEPETHAFLNYLLPKLPSAIIFVDVGANIGEMMIDVSKHKNVKNLIAVEPIGACAEAIKKSLDLNRVRNYVIIEKLMGAAIGYSPFTQSQSVGGSSIFSPESVASKTDVQMTTLDHELELVVDDTIILIDVEGYEPQVLEGGLQFINRRKPLIIFEYNDVSKMHFKCADIRAILGPQYVIYRLRSDATLDKNLEMGWNCVAVPRNTEFSQILQCD